MTDPHPHTNRLRVGDAERAAAGERLSAHAAAGRLTVEELEQRLEAANDAVFARDLEVLEADLPSLSTPVTRGRVRVPRPAVPLALLALEIVATALTGHPVVAPLFVAFVMWRLSLAFGGPRRRLHGPPLA